ncbi:hypothetical protein TIFTF001_033822 [Ficus carica]|uniref:Uncharacterized protein n=1 Tax=Ficus carica TaxID=3494 RepID=A0AA88J839_FICCA|nr:hypothetical protein TIFTF001_033822 [Ficus carica]
MEKFKVHYTEVLLHRVKEKSSDRYEDTLKDERGELRALDCYRDTHTMKTDSLAYSMVLDGCFMIELFRRNKNSDKYTDSGYDILFNIRWVKPRLEHDLLLFENQIPLLVLRALFSLTEQTTKEGHFIPLVLSFFVFNGKPIPYDKNLTTRLDDIPHLLGLVYEALVPCKKESALISCEKKDRILGGNKKALLSRGKEDLDSSEEVEDLELGPPLPNWKRKSLRWIMWTVLVRLIEKTFRLKTVQQLNNERKSCEFIWTAVALEQVGVTFVRVEDNVAFYDIKFSSTGVLSIPRLVIDDNTESFFRNLVAYEQYSEKNRLHRVVDYLHVMDCLINTSKDVVVLRHCGIIDNRIGDDAKVSTMFNRLCSDVYFNQDEFFYKRMFDDVNQFCMDRRNAWKATLKNEYFSSPWSVTSFIAAVLLLLFTATQTLYSVLSYYHSSS